MSVPRHAGNAAQHIYWFKLEFTSALVTPVVSLFFKFSCEKKGLGLRLSACSAPSHLGVLTLDGPQDDAMFDPLHHLVHRLHFHVIHTFSSSWTARGRQTQITPTGLT